MVKMPVTPKLISWAVERSGYPFEKIESKFKNLSSWITGDTQPTWRQFHDFARMVHVPFGYLFLKEPPEESLPIPDFRTLDSDPINQPSPNLLDTIDLCQFRQDWYRDHIISERTVKVELIGTETLNSKPKTVASKVRRLLKFEPTINNKKVSKDTMIGQLIRQLEEIGILVMISGIVGSNSHRKLDIHEFRGFTLCDVYAPIIFINGADSKAAQLFTLCHELAHLTIGTSGLTNVGITQPQKIRKQEKWCNAVAAEILVPLDLLQETFNQKNAILYEIKRLSNVFKVSNLVILRRLLDANFLNQSEFKTYWGREMTRLKKQQGNKKGGQFYSTILNRVGNKFASAIISSTLNGKTLYRDAFELLGISKTSTFNKLVQKVESKNGIYA